MLNTRLVACLLVLMQVSACEPENHAELHGSLYFGVGQYLAELELHNGNVNIETNLGDVEIRGLLGGSNRLCQPDRAGSGDTGESHQAAR